MQTYQVIVIGGGLGGLTAASALAKAGVSVLLLEKKKYPYHKVCGEYLSHEVVPYLEYLGLDLTQPQPAQLKTFELTAPNGRKLTAELDMGGIGISRYALDKAMYDLAQLNGATILTDTEVVSKLFHENAFTIETSAGKIFNANYVIASYGKRSKLDIKREFFKRKSPYMAVKYHIKTDFALDTIALHNFENGYCGISAIENQTFCLCYLSHRSNLKKWGSIPKMEQEILWQNPHLKHIFTNSTFVFDKPLVINEISFAPKSCIENHMLMVGDTAGLITRSVAMAWP